MNLRKPRTVKPVVVPEIAVEEIPHTPVHKPEARTGKQWRIEALTEAMSAVAHIDAARRAIKVLLRKTEES